MLPHSLHHTERRLITLFVGWAFLFLIIFEGVFLAGRIILEGRFLRDELEKGTDRIIERMTDTAWVGRPDTPKRWGPPIGLDIGFLVVDKSGTIVENRLSGLDDTESISEIISQTSDADWETSYNGEWYQKKIPHPKNPNLDVIIIKTGRYDSDDILRDILRFLILDITILVPFWFMGRYFVRETLRPVAENMDTMSHFVHDAGHELKTPLAIISGNLQLLRDIPKKDDTLIVESIDTIANLATSLDGLIELANLRKPETITSTPLLETVEHIMKMHTHALDARHITHTIQIPKNATLPIERWHFSLLLSNLIKNAITYNKDSGNISISYKKWVFSITDTGIGMNKEDIPKIFERFYRADRSGKYPGTGIGLALVDRIVRLYDGTITVESELGKGTTFSLMIK